MRGIHADYADTGRWQIVSRNRHVEGECGRAADDLAVLERSVHAVEPKLVDPALHLLFLGRRAEVLADGEERSAELLQVPNRTNVESHAPTYEMRSRGA
jgi:hypothetical protein